MNRQLDIGTRHNYFVAELVSVCHGFKSRRPGNNFFKLRKLSILAIASVYCLNTYFI
jgi:hypothetical protein